MSALITVVICTYERYSLLRKLLVALEEQKLPRDRFHILVVDNSRTKEDREAFALEMRGRPGMEIIESLPPGLSRARNVGVSNCRSEIITFIDDDAVPDPKWLDALLRAFERTDASTVGGPIEPIWPRPRPEWVPDKYVACLTVLDLGTEDRPMTDWEFAYGTNMAFRTRVLRESGGFSEDLGRTGSRTLLSDEEIQLQLALRASGHTAYYAAEAKVFHRVHENRISRNYFRSRMAWQAVSMLMHDSPFWAPAQARQDLMKAAAQLGIADSLERLFTVKDAKSFSAQIDIIYNFLLITLGGNQGKDEEFEGAFENPSTPSEESSSIVPDRAAGRISSDTYLPTPIVDPQTSHLFVEGGASHAYLFDVYAGVPNSQLVLLPGPIWDDCSREIMDLTNLPHRKLRSLTFITVEALIYTDREEALTHLLERSRVPVYGFLHRLPWEPSHGPALRRIARRMAGFLVLAEEMQERLREDFDIQNVHYVPLHATHHPYIGRDSQPTRRRMGVKADQVVVSVLGEARASKGIGLLLDSLEYISPQDKDRLFFLIAGKGTDFSQAEVSERLRLSGCHGFVDLRGSSNSREYTVLPDAEFGWYVNASDAGAVLYQGNQRTSMSAVLPNYAAGGKQVVATANSFVGKMVDRYHLGFVVESETPQEVALALARLTKASGTVPIGDEIFERFRRSTTPDAVVSRLTEILEKNAGLDIAGARNVASANEGYRFFTAT